MVTRKTQKAPEPRELSAAEIHALPLKEQLKRQWPEIELDDKE